MADYRTIKGRLTSLEDETLYSIAELICDLEAQNAEQEERIQQLEADLSGAELRAEEAEARAAT